MSTNLIKSVIVLGATGSVGPAIVDALLAAGLTVSTLTRNPAKAKAKFPSNVKVVESEYTAASLVKAFRGQDAVISAIATFSTQEQIKIIDAAVEAGVRRFLPSEYGIDLSTAEAVAALPIGKPKFDTVTYLRSKESTGLSWTGVVVGGFFDWSFSFPGLLGWNLPEKKATIFDGGDVPFEVTNLEQIGRAVAAVLSPGHLKDTANTYVFVNSFNVTQNQVLASLENATGSKFDIMSAKRRDLAEVGKEKMKAGVFEEVGGGRYLVGSLEAITAEIHNYSGLNNYSKNRGLWNEKLGLPKEDLDATIQRVLQ